MQTDLISESTTTADESTDEVHFQQTIANDRVHLHLSLSYKIDQSR